MGAEHLLNKNEQVVADTVKAAFKGGVTYFDCHPGHDNQEDIVEYKGYVKH
jgi:hypothetical protein